MISKTQPVEAGEYTISRRSLLTLISDSNIQSVEDITVVVDGDVSSATWELAWSAEGAGRQIVTIGSGTFSAGKTTVSITDFSGLLNADRRGTLSLSARPNAKYTIDELVLTRSIDVDVHVGSKFEEKDLTQYSENRYGRRFFDTLGRRKQCSIVSKVLSRDKISVIWGFLQAAGKTTPLTLEFDDNNLPISDTLWSGEYYLDAVPQVNPVSQTFFEIKIDLTEKI